MTPHDLLTNFETLVEAPIGIQRLRELVLELAVRGKLVEQDPAEGLAQNQFPNLCSGRLGSDSPKRGRQLKGPDAPELAPEDFPANAIWVPIGQLMDLYNGRAFKPNEWATTGLPIIRIQNLNDPSASFNFCNFEVPEKVHVHDGDLLISWSGTPGTSFGAFIWNRGHAVLNQHIFRVELRHPKLVPEYIRLSVNARLDEMISRAHGGVGLRHITKGELEAIGIPIPPEAEQRRIVARVDELMALLGRLDAKRQDREAARTAARDSALAALREAPTADDVETTWLRIQERFGELFATPEDLQPLRVMILELAIQGRLVGQNLEDEPVGKLLDRIKSARVGLIRAKRVRAGRPQPSVTNSEIPFEIPSSWSWTRLGEVGDWGAGATPTRGNSSFYGGDINWFKSGELPDGILKGPSSETITELALAKFSLRENKPGDVLIALYGATIGKLAVLDSYGTTNQAVCGCTCFADLYNRYLFMFLMAWRRRFVAQGEGGAQPNISKEKVIATVIPIPPLPEQYRIVARVEELMLMLDRLSEALQHKLANAIAFASAVVHHFEI